MLNSDILHEFAAKYIWWKAPDAAARYPHRVIAQVMELGTFEDIQRLVKAAGAPCLIDVIQRAEAGWFTPRSWHFWNLRLGLCDPRNVPPLPERAIR